MPLFLLFDFVVWRAGEASNEETTHIFEIDGQTEAVFGGGEGEAWVPCLDATPRTFFFVVLAFLVAVWTTSVPGMFVFGGARPVFACMASKTFSSYSPLTTGGGGSRSVKIGEHTGSHQLCLLQSCTRVRVRVYETRERCVSRWYLILL